MADAATLAKRLARVSPATRGPEAPLPFSSPSAFSPLVQSYHQWISATGSVQPLPRTVQDFLSGAFGPLAPIVPFGIDLPRPDTGRPSPRRMQYPVGHNLPSFPGANFKLVSFATLRSFADVYSVARTCINVRIHEIAALDWDIVPTTEAHEAMRGDRAAKRDFQERRNVALAWWRRPDPNYFGFASWLRALLEEILVVDALSLYLHPTRANGKGPFGSDLAALELLAGDTIYPLLDLTGATPRPPAPSYHQYIWGVPRSEYTTVILGEDEKRIRDEFGEPVATYAADQLLYLPYWRRAWTPYGFPPLEQAVLPVSTGLRRQQWRLEFYTEGSIPGLFVVAPPEWSPQQIRQLQDALNALGGDLGMKWRHVVLPGHTEIREIKSVDQSAPVDYVIYEETLMVFGVKPMEIGLLPGGRSLGLGGRGMQEAQQRASQVQRLRPLARWLESVFNHVIWEVWKQPDLRFAFHGIEDEEDDEAKTKRLIALVTAGLITRDEAREELDREPFGLPETAEPAITTGAGIVPLDENEPAPIEEVPPPPAPVPAGRRAPGVRGHPPEAPAPAPVALEETHATAKQALAELDQLRQYLRHGKDPARFVARVLSPHLVRTVSERTRAGDLSTAVSWARKVVQGVAQRQEVVDDLVATLDQSLWELAQQVVAGEMSEEEFVDAATEELADAYLQALRRGAEVENPAFVAGEAETATATLSAAAQRLYLAGLAAALLAGAGDPSGAAALRQRVRLYANSLQARYEEGRQRGWTAHHQIQPLIIWHASSASACDLCAGRSGWTFTPETLPGYPGDGGFGGPICRGGVLCRCWLEYRRPEPGEEPDEGDAP